MGHPGHNEENRVFWKNPIVIVCLLAVGYWVYTYHLEHALGLLPYAILLLCPLMHVFMHGGHGHGDNSGEQKCNHPDHHKENQ